MAITGQARRYDLKFNFKVLIAGLSPEEADFATCSEASVTVGEATLWQGGSFIPIKEPTRLTFADITLERGMSRSMSLWTWFKDTSDAASGRGLISPFFKRPIHINQRDRAGIITEAIVLYNAWPKEYSAGDWSNDADEFRIERLVVAYDWFERIPFSLF